MRTTQISFFNTWRLAVLCLVLVLHGSILTFAVLHKVGPQNSDAIPLFVDFIEARSLHRQAPAAKSSSVMRKPVENVLPRKTVTPSPLETTTSNEPSQPSAPVVTMPAPVPANAAGGNGSSDSTSGDGTQVQARFDADYLRNPSPPYPPRSRRLGEEGKVILRVLVSPEGTAQQVDIKASSGISRLDESAQRTVRTWKFIPAKRSGIAVESWVLVPILFKLEQ